MGLLVNLFTIAGGSALLTGKSISEKRHAKKLMTSLNKVTLAQTKKGSAICSICYLATIQNSLRSSKKFGARSL